MSEHLKSATFGGGCFWCVEAVFQRLEGVERVESGYAGGHVENPTYEQVCGKKTGHVEVIQIDYDPDKINFVDLLEVFFATHDPTTPDRQGNDVGPQYRSIIFFHDEEQKQLAEEYKTKLGAAKVWDQPIVTGIEPLTNYYPAESYHQNYFNDNPAQSYCLFLIRPKVEKFEEVFKSRLKTTHRGNPA